MIAAQAGPADVPVHTADAITDADIRVFLDESRFSGDRERARAALGALGNPTGDGALGLLDQTTCRARVAEIILREHTPGTSAARTPSPVPVCGVCGDTHRMTLRDREVMCTRCPLPCRECATANGTGAFCDKTPCSCECHLELVAGGVAVLRGGSPGSGRFA